MRENLRFKHFHGAISHGRKKHNQDIEPIRISDLGDPESKLQKIESNENQVIEGKENHKPEKLIKPLMITAKSDSDDENDEWKPSPTHRSHKMPTPRNQKVPLKHSKKKRTSSTTYSKSRTTRKNKLDAKLKSRDSSPENNTTIALTPPESDKSRESTPENIQPLTRKTRRVKSLQNEKIKNNQTRETELTEKQASQNRLLEIEPPKNEPLQNAAPQNEHLAIEPKSESLPTEVGESGSEHVRLKIQAPDPFSFEPLQNKLVEPGLVKIQSPKIEPVGTELPQSESPKTETVQIEPSDMSLNTSKDQHEKRKTRNAAKISKKQLSKKKSPKPRTLRSRKSAASVNKNDEKYNDVKISENDSDSDDLPLTTFQGKKVSNKNQSNDFKSEAKTDNAPADLFENSKIQKRKFSQKMKPKSVLAKEAAREKSLIREHSHESSNTAFDSDNEIPALEKVTEKSEHFQKISAEIPAMEKVSENIPISPMTLEKSNHSEINRTKQNKTAQKSPSKEIDWLSMPEIDQDFEKPFDPMSLLNSTPTYLYSTPTPITIPFSSTPKTKNFENIRRSPKRLKSLDLDQRSTIGRYFAENSSKQMFEVIKHFELLWNVRFSKYVVQNIKKELSELNFESNQNTSIKIEVVEDTMSLVIPVIPAIPENTRKRLVSESSTGKTFKKILLNFNHNCYLISIIFKIFFETSFQKRLLSKK